MLRRFAENEILVTEAKNRGITLSDAAKDSARTELRDNLRNAAKQAGLLDIQPQQGETPQQAVERRVDTLLGNIISQQQPPLTLGALSFSLRRQFKAEIMDQTFPAVVKKVEETRPPAPEMKPMPGGPIQLPNKPSHGDSAQQAAPAPGAAAPAVSGGAGNGAAAKP